MRMLYWGIVFWFCLAIYLTQGDIWAQPLAKRDYRLALTLRFITRHGKFYLLILNRKPALLTIGLRIRLTACGQELARVRTHLRGIDLGPNRIPLNELGLPDVTGLIPENCDKVVIEVRHLSEPQNRTQTIIPVNEFLKQTKAYKAVEFRSDLKRQNFMMRIRSVRTRYMSG